MAVLSGKKGSITFATGYVAHCHAWTVNIIQDTFEDTELGDSWRTRLTGLADWSGSFECSLDSKSLSDVTGLAIGEEAAAANFIFEDAGKDGEISGTIIITVADLSASIADRNAISFTFEGSGAPTIVQSS